MLQEGGDWLFVAYTRKPGFYLAYYVYFISYFNYSEASLYELQGGGDWLFVPYTQNPDSCLTSLLAANSEENFQGFLFAQKKQDGEQKQGREIRKTSQKKLRRISIA